MEVSDQKKNNNGVKIYNSVVEEHYDYDDNHNRKVTKRKSKEGYLDKNGKAHYKESNYFINDEGKKHEEEIYADDKEFVAKQQEDQDIKYFTEDKKTINEQDFNKKKETFNTLKKENNIIDNGFKAMNDIFSSPVFSHNNMNPIFEDNYINDFGNNNIDNVNNFFSIFEPALKRYKPFGLLPMDTEEEKRKEDNNKSAVDRIQKSFNNIKKLLPKNNITEENKEIEEYKKTISKLQKRIQELENSIKKLQNTNRKLLNTKSIYKRSKSF